MFAQVSGDSQLPETVRYQSLHWECKHFGKYKSRGTGKREICHAYAKGCPVQITVV